MAAKKVIQGECQNLRTVCTRVEHFDEGLCTLMADLTNTMQTCRVLSLSAPQIGVPIQAVVLSVGGNVVELINPVVIKAVGQQKSVEHCASFPGTAFEIERSERMTVEGQDRHGQPVHVEASGLLARLLQHEMDHLQGILFYDRLQEEDLFQQLIGELEDGEGASSVYAIAAGNGQDAAEASSRQQIVDMIADAAWKFTLALELLQEIDHSLSETQVSDLQETADRLRDWVDPLESQLLANHTDE